MDKLTGIIYVGKFKKGYRWMAEVLATNARRIHSPVLMSRIHHHTQYDANHAALAALGRCGISNQISVIVGDNNVLLDDDTFWDWINSWSGPEGELKWKELAKSPKFVSRKRRNLKDR